MTVAWLLLIRTKFRKEMNAMETEASSKAIDSLINYETVKVRLSLMALFVVLRLRSLGVRKPTDLSRSIAVLQQREDGSRALRQVL
jgi:hypothetical protein